MHERRHSGTVGKVDVSGTVVDQHFDVLNVATNDVDDERCALLASTGRGSDEIETSTKVIQNRESRDAIDVSSGVN